MSVRGPETERSHKARISSGFYDKYMSGLGLDIGYGGAEFETVLPGALGWDKSEVKSADMGHPEQLPFPNDYFDFCYSSHTIEHLDKPLLAISEWHRVVKPYGHVIICAPHQYLYERKKDLPSKWNGGHRRFLTPDKLLSEINNALKPNSWRLVHCRDNDDGYDYFVPLDKHPNGAYEIECVIQKIQMPEWGIE